MVGRDAEATRRRILAAATAEFAAAGFSGARVDRIAAAAASNVRMIYAYFGDKDGLFRAALTASIGAMAAAVPPRADDLAAWAGELFDYHHRDPTALRIAMWAQLERPSTAAEPLEAFLVKTAALERRARPPLRAVDLLVIVYAVAQAWLLSPIGLRAADGADPDDPARVRAHRAAVVAAVERMVGAE
jgi:AcrR family transcriptional regulator